MRRLLVLMGGVAALGVATSPAVAQHRGGAHARVLHPAAPAPTDWVHHVERTPEGGYRMGNPAAPLKLVEYGSIACPHCAEFAEMANAQLRTKFVRTGRVSFEYRPYLIFSADPGIFQLLACQSPARFFDTADRLYATQEAWRGRIRQHETELQGLAAPQLYRATLRASGVEAVFLQGGLSQRQIDACLADQVGLQRLMGLNHAAEQLGVRGTPTLFLNGREIEVANWAALETLLNQG